MKCKQVIRSLNAYIDKELSATKSKSIEEHLHICKDCEQEYHSLQLLNNSLFEYKTPVLSEELYRKLLAVTQQKQAKISVLRLQERLRQIPIAASILLTFASALFLGKVLTDTPSTADIPKEYQFASESLYTLWEGIDYER